MQRNPALSARESRNARRWKDMLPNRQEMPILLLRLLVLGHLSRSCPSFGDRRLRRRLDTRTGRSSDALANHESRLSFPYTTLHLS